MNQNDLILHVVFDYQSYCSAQYNKLIAVFHFSRTRGMYFLQVYAPSLVIVAISWISSWIDPKMVPGRVGLCVTTLLTLSTQVTANAKMPN